MYRCLPLVEEAGNARLPRSFRSKILLSADTTINRPNSIATSIQQLVICSLAVR